MSQPLIDLQRLLRDRTSVTGQVVSVGAGVARVATPSGIIELSADTGIQPGDRVMVRNGRAIRSQVATKHPVYCV